MSARLKIFILLSALLLVQSPKAYPLLQDLKFEHLSTPEGLPSEYVTIVFQDHLGFLWFGTRKGLVRYDGYTMKIYQPEKTDPSSINGEWIRSIVEDQNGNLWIGTWDKGMNKFERRTGCFTHFEHNPQDSTSISSNKILTTVLDSAGLLWILSADSTIDNMSFGKDECSNATMAFVMSITFLDRIDTKTGNVDRLHFNQKKNSLAASVSNWFVGGFGIYALLEDDNSDVWIGTWGDGLYRYDRDRNTFLHYEQNPSDKMSLSHNIVRSIAKDSTGTIWVATWGGGLNRYNRETDSFFHYRYQQGNHNGIASDFCMNVYVDRSNNIWVSLPSRLDRLNQRENLFSHYKPQSRYSAPHARDIFLPVFQEESAILWLVAWARQDPNHIITLNPISGDYYVQRENPYKSNSIIGVNFMDLCQDRYGTIWLASSGRGINKLDPRAQLFTQYANQPNNTNSLDFNTVWSVEASKYNPDILWIGTHQGLDKYDKKNYIFTHFKQNRNDPNTLAFRRVMKLLEDTSGDLWIGSNASVGLIDKSGKMTSYIRYINRPEVFGSSNVWGMCQDSLNNIWMVDNWVDRGGLVRYNIKDSTFQRFFHDPENPASCLYTQSWCLFADKNGFVWVGSSDGLSKFDPNDETFTHYLSDKHVNNIFEDTNNNLWIGTLWSGLGLFDREKKTATFYTRQDGLADHRVEFIEQDQKGNIWFTTVSALMQFDPRTKKFTNFTRYIGLSDVLFYKGTKGPDGQMYICTSNNGVLSFDPDELEINRYPPDIVFTDFKIFDQSILSDSNSILIEDITTLNEISLSHWQNDVSLEMTALHYSLPQENQYAYYLENYDREWRYSVTNRIATYTNLDPGTYIFHAKAANSDGVWNEEGTSLRIIIHPPWWATWWAYGIYFLLVVFIVLFTWRLQLRRIHLKNDLKMRTFESKKLKEVDSLKSRFFANISHEFRTPITLILGPLEKIQTTTKDDGIKGDLSIMRRNAQRLHRLINQLLDLSRIEAGRMTLKAQHVNIVQLVNRYVQSFESQAKINQVDLIFHAHEKNIWMFVDPEKLENIIYNLVSNALKFTQNGKIEIFVGKQESDNDKDGFVEISVSDTGKGMPKDHLDKVFDRFYQVDESKTREHEGSGIGLALTKELVELHKGEISVSSQLNKGSTFTVLLPLGKDHLTADEIGEEIQDTHAPQPSQSIERPVSHIEHPASSDHLPVSSIKHPASTTTHPEPHTAYPTSHTPPPLLLIIEDNRDLRTYIRDILNSEYRVKEAPDGEQGLKQAFDIIPDLIISDVMMPGMDGFEMCKKLKTDERTSHIPVILLTARAGIESKLEGLETGADDYIIKPFETKELLVRVKNLIEMRQKLKQHFGRSMDLNLKGIAVTSTDERFLQRACDIIDFNISDSGFSVSHFAKNVGLSRAQLYRKLHGLVNQSASEFIRTIRLKRAAELIRRQAGNITEVAYQVGFSSASYFSKCFRRQFGVLPSDYVNKGNNSIQKSPK